MSVITVEGYVSAEFGPIADVFARLAAGAGEAGAALCVFQHGREVVRLSVGRYSCETPQVVFSVSKLLMALALHRAAARGELDLDADLGAVWPEFARAGGRGIRIRDVLAHRTTMAALDVTMTLDEVLRGGDRDAVLDAAPFARATVDHGYHAVTFGTILGAVIESRFGLPVGDWLVRELESIAGGISLGDAAAPTATIRFSPPAETAAPYRKEGMRDGLLEALTADPQTFNSPTFLAAGVSSMGVVASAGDLARVMASTIGEVDGFRLLDEPARKRMTEPQAWGTDRVLGVDTAFGSGPQLPFARLPFTGPDAFGHEGAGGSVAFADPRTALAVGFTTDLFPASAGASPVLLALLPSLGLLAAAASD